MPKSKCHKKRSDSSSSCSLLSVTGLNSDASSSKSKDTISCTVSLSSSSSDSSSSSSSSVSSLSSSSGSVTISNPCSSSSSSCSSSSSSCGSSSSSCGSSSSSCGSSSSSCGSSSSLTYTSNTTSSSSSSSSCPSSSSSSCSSSDSSCSFNCVKCVKTDDSDCKKLVKQYSKSKDLLRANNDTIILLEFIKNKLVAVQPNIDVRHVQNYPIQANIEWLETFVDTLFCVLRKNDAYKAIKVKDCKVKNNSDERVSDRLYLIKTKFQNNCKVECRTYPLDLYWSRLTYNDAKSFKGILNYAITELHREITVLKAENTQPFLSHC